MVTAKTAGRHAKSDLEFPSPASLMKKYAKCEPFVDGEIQEITNPSGWNLEP